MNFLHEFTSFLWAYPMPALLLGTHLFFTFRLKGIQFHLFKQFKALFMHKKTDNGEISQFSSLMAILASTMGTGNVLGVSTALIAGGPGSIFWMVIAGFLGMATKYAETWLAVKHRKRQNDGTFLGGAMVVLKNKHSFLSAFFCISGALAALGIGCSVQSNAAALMLYRTFQIPLICTAVLFSLLTALVIFKGLKGISALCNILVPLAGTVYLFTSLLLLYQLRHSFSPALQLIITSAFNTHSILGGFFGASVKNAIRYGVSRGLFTNESGMGSTPIFSASSECTDLKVPSYIAMLSVFLDTVVICSLTGILFVSCSLSYPPLASLTSANDFSLACFSLIPVIGKPVLCLCLVLFALSTILGWCVVGERLLCFLFGSSACIPYRILWIVFVFAGCMIQMDDLWAISDLFNAFMCIPNLYMLFSFEHQIN